MGEAMGKDGRRRKGQLRTAHLDWQVHVYGEASAEIRTLCEERKMPLHVFPWGPEVDRAGLGRDAVYLVRPDGYVAMAASERGAAAVAAYLDAHKLVDPNASSSR